jgi:hypothetical protein
MMMEVGFMGLLYYIVTSVLSAVQKQCCTPAPFFHFGAMIK